MINHCFFVLFADRHAVRKLEEWVSFGLRRNLQFRAVTTLTDISLRLCVPRRCFACVSAEDTPAPVAPACPTGHAQTLCHTVDQLTWPSPW